MSPARELSVDTQQLSSPPSAKKQKLEQPRLPVFKVTKPGIKRATKGLPKALQRPVAPAGKRYPVKIRADGLIDVEDVPDYLVAAVNRNATQSLLLRLDKDLRMKILILAMGGHTIEIRARESHCVGQPSKDCASKEASSPERSTPNGNFPSPEQSTSPEQQTFPETSTSLIDTHPSFPTPQSRGPPQPKPQPTGPPYTGRLSHAGPKRTQPKTAFRLPLVCRQLYLESSLLPYILSLFSFPGTTPFKHGLADGPDGALEGWAATLIPAHRSAVRRIRPHWHDVQLYLSERSKLAFVQVFAGLKVLRVPSRAVNEVAGWPSRVEPMRGVLRGRAKERIVEMARVKEGRGMEVVFCDVDL